MKSIENNRGFGLLFCIFFLVVGMFPLIKGEDPRIIYLPISIIFLFLGVINSKILTPLKKLWIKLGDLLGIIIAPIIMGLVYFLILTPLSIIVKVAGKDLLKLKFSNKVKSYWIKRDKDPGSMDKQF
jgi:hypothetical protein|tara:strand:- start:288 stop:668 length:381 start_codon:yes stop_codon:yes gene_type:complete